MTKYVLDHHLTGERARLALMSRLLDPMHRRHLEELGIARARAVEVGCGNGSISGWLARQVGPAGRVVAVDLDLSLIGVAAPNPRAAPADICAGPSSPAPSIWSPRGRPASRRRRRCGYPQPRASLAPGGGILLIEPDFLPVSVAAPPEVEAFWDGWLAWSQATGHRLPYRPHPGPAARRARPRAGRRHGRDRRLQWRLALGRLLDRHGHRAAPAARGLGQRSTTS